MCVPLLGCPPVYSRSLTDENGLHWYINLVVSHYRPTHFESSASEDFDEFSIEGDELPNYQESLWLLHDKQTDDGAERSLDTHV